MFKRAGLYLTAQRSHAAWVCLVSALLPFFQLPTFSLAVIILGLVTLHKGAKEGLILSCWILLPSIAAAFYVGIDIFLVEALGKVLIVWLAACVLGHYNRWSACLQVIVFCGLLMIAFLHLLIPDMSAWWLARLHPMAAQIQNTLNLDVSVDDFAELLQKASHFMTGILASGVLALDAVLLLVARIWQASLFNPDGFKQEWQHLRMGYAYAAVSLLIGIGACLQQSLLMDLLPIVLIPFLFAGLSLIHTLLLPQKRKIRLAILISLYVGLLMFTPYVPIMIILMAFIDTWMNFRKMRS